MVILFQYGFAARGAHHIFSSHSFFQGGLQGYHRAFGSMDCPEAKGILVVRIGTDQGDFGAGCQRKRFFPVFQKYHALHGSFLCQPAVFLTQEQPGFLRFICSPEGVFEQSQLVFQLQDTHYGFIKLFFINSAFLNQFPQIVGITACTHIDIHARFHGQTRRFLLILRGAVDYQLGYGSIIGDDNTTCFPWKGCRPPC